MGLSAVCDVVFLDNTHFVYSYLIGLYYNTKGWKVEIFDIILVVNNLSNARKLYVQPWLVIIFGGILY